MVNETKLVSILVASYNQEDYIIDCLESILHQTYNNIEVLIADDCSKDDTYKKTQEWVEHNGNQFSFCKSIKNKENLGISKNYNSLIKHAKGKYIKLIAADDILLENGIKTLVEYLEEHTEDAIAFGNCYYIGRNDHYPLPVDKERTLFYLSVPRNGQNLVKDLLMNDYIAAPTVMIRSDTIDTYGLFREDLVFEDWEYWLRLSSAGEKIGYINTPIVAYRLHDFSSSHVGKGKEEEARFRRILESEKKIYSEYTIYVDSEMLDVFWNRRLEICIENNYFDTLQEIMYKESFKLSSKNRIKLLLYHLGLYRVIKAIRWIRGIRL